MGPARLAVVGAGAFGGWTALWARRKGADVALLDAEGAGNTRGSSGGATRLMRCGYGPIAEFSALAFEAARLWEEEEPKLGGGLWVRNGVLWLFRSSGDGFAAATVDTLTRLQIPHECVSTAEVRRRWPKFALEPLQSALYEPGGGFLYARRACQKVAERLVAEGGRCISGLARPGRSRGGRLLDLELATGERREADAFVFACGPWLAKQFPDVVGRILRVTRQELFYFETPDGDPWWREDRMPCWIDYDSGIWYGIPGNGGLGFKLGDHQPGPPFDPDLRERVPSPEGLASARGFLRRAFPALAGAPLLRAEVCQYELAPELRPFCLRHPAWSNVWLLGGGSGHGFKLAPALGARSAAQVLAG